MAFLSQHIGFEFVSVFSVCWKGNDEGGCRTVYDLGEQMVEVTGEICL